MQLILVRHAEAASVGQLGATRDFDRPLTPHGHATARRLTDRLKATGVRAGVVTSSPLLRAQQTAAPLLELADGELVTIDELAPDSHKPKKVARALADLGAGTVIAVGHLPDIAYFAGWLIGTGGVGVAFDKGTAALIEVGAKVEEGAGTLEWLVSPGWY
ncbi:MAG: histidine phosphatase family protein [Gemmataceae bacterium]